MSLTDAAVIRSTIVPLITYDEGQGAPSGYSANPQNAAFAEANQTNCYPESKVSNFQTFLTISLTKGTLETDKLTAIKLAFMPIYTAFLDNLVAKDEVSGITTESALELAHETTDRQVYPIFGTTKISEKFTGSAVMHADQDNLTTTQRLEGVDFDVEQYYDVLQYCTNAPVIRNSSGGLKWITLTRQKPVFTAKINLRSKSKAMNPYTFMGLLLHLPEDSSHYQYPIDADTTAINHVYFSITTRFLEWNPYYDMERQ